MRELYLQYRFLFCLIVCCELFVLCTPGIDPAPKIESSGHLNVKSPEIKFDTQLIDTIIPGRDSNSLPFITKAGIPQVIAANFNQNYIIYAEIVKCAINSPVINKFIQPKPVEVRQRVQLAKNPVTVVAGDPNVRDRNPHNFRTFTKKQGLRNNFILSILEDRNGNIWMSDYSGVNKYNGKSFEIYSTIEGLPASNIRSMLEDKEGNIWFCTYENGVAKFDGKYFTYITEAEGLLNNKVRSVTEDKQGDIWFGTEIGISRYDGTSMFYYDINQGLTDQKVSAVFCDRKGTLWVGTYKGMVFKFDGEKFIQVTTELPLPNFPIRSIIDDEKGNLWFASSGGGVFKFNRTSFEIINEKSGLSSNQVWSMAEDQSGKIWLATESGLCKIEDNKLTVYNENDGLPLRVIKSIFNDKHGNLWIGTYGGGLSLYSGGLFTYITEQDGLPNNLIRALLEDHRGNMWIGTYNGLSCFNGKTFTNYKVEQGLRNNNIRSLYEDKKGIIWVGTDKGICFFDGQRFTAFSDKKGILNCAILSIIQDRDGNFWFGTWGAGLVKYDGKSFIRFDKKSGLTDNFIWWIYEDMKGRLFLGTGLGVNIIDGKVIKQFTTANGLSNNSVWSIIEDKQQNIWIGTLGGITILSHNIEHSNNRFRQFEDYHILKLTDKEGLAGNDIVSLMCDKNGDIFIGTGLGLSIIENKKINQLEQLLSQSGSSSNTISSNYNYSDGFLGIGVNEGRSMYQKQNGEIWIGSTDRLTIFHDQGNVNDSILPCMQITSIELFNELINWTDLSHRLVVNDRESKKRYSKDTSIFLGNGVKISDFKFDDISAWQNLPVNLSLKYNNNYITFNYVGITQKQNNKILYQYKLEGIDDHWSSPTKRTSATYGNLPNGKFNFKVKAINSDGYWSNEVVYSFTIRPPWWKTILFKILFTIVSILLLVGFYRWRIHALQNQKKYLEQVVHEKTAEIIDQNEELITLNAEQKTLNEELTAVNEELYNQREELEITIENLKKTQKQLVQSEKMASLGVLAAGITHEINNPLNFIACGTFIIEQYFEENYPNQMQELKPMLDSIKLGVKRSTDIVTSLNQFSRQGSSNNEQCNLHSIIDNCLTILQNELKLRIDIIKNYTSESFELTGNEGKLHQVFINILSNASQAIEGKGLIKITTLMENNDLKIIIADTGCGISAENLLRINDPFFTTKEAGKGVGLGLSIVYSIVNEHNGSIEYESELGKGTTVIVKLPVKTDDNLNE